MSVVTGRIVWRVRWEVIGIALAFLSCTGPHAWGESDVADPCADAERVSTTKYCYWIMEGGDVIGESDAGLCFGLPSGKTYIVPARVLVEARSSGRLDACFEDAARTIVGTLLTSGMTDYYDESSWPEEYATLLKVQRTRVHEIVGREFETQGEAEAWHKEHRCLLRWHPDTRQLLVAEDLKARGEFLLDCMRRVSAEDFATERHVRPLVIQEGVLVYEAQPPIGLPYLSSVPLTELREGENLQLVRNLVLGWIIRLGFDRQDGPPPTSAVLIERLQQLTGQEFSTAQEWATWWAKHHEDVRVSEDGQHLVVRSWWDKVRGK